MDSVDRERLLKMSENREDGSLERTLREALATREMLQKRVAEAESEL